MNDNELYNDFTREYDKYLVTDFNFYKENFGDVTYLLRRDYLLEDDNQKIWPFRVPGATRGHIKTDQNNIITEIKFYDDTCFGINSSTGIFDINVIEATNKFLNTKLIFNN